MFAPATLCFCFHGPVLPKPNSQLQSSKLKYHSLLRYLVFSCVLTSALADPFHSHAECLPFSSIWDRFFCLCSKFLFSAILSLHDLIASSNSKMSAFVELCSYDWLVIVDFVLTACGSICVPVSGDVVRCGVLSFTAPQSAL